jgi:hypothetical protein
VQVEQLVQVGGHHQQVLAAVGERFGALLGRADALA